MKYKVSIIIPVFNTEKFLEECLLSIQKQTFSDYEVICIDDGSSDNSLYLLESLRGNDIRIKVLNQMNCGAGLARNLGLQTAKGKYVIFLDSDDCFDSRLIEKMVYCAEANDADVCICKAWAVYENLNKVDLNFNNKLFEKYDNSFFLPADVNKDIFTSFLVEPWNKMYLRDYLLKNELMFQGIKKTNDLFFTSMSLVKARKIALVNEKLVFYRLDNRHKVVTVYEEKLLDHYRAISKTKEALFSEEKCLSYLSSYYKMALNVILYNLNLNFSEEVRKKLYQFYINTGLRELGLLREEVLKQLGFLGRIQVKLLYLGAPSFINNFFYKFAKTIEYISKNGFRSTIMKIVK